MSLIAPSQSWKGKKEGDSRKRQCTAQEQCSGLFLCLLGILDVSTNLRARSLYSSVPLQLQGTKTALSYLHPPFTTAKKTRFPSRFPSWHNLKYPVGLTVVRRQSRAL